MKKITIAAHHDGRMSAICTWDLRDVDTQDMEIKKVVVSDEQLKEIDECTSQNRESILRILYKSK